MSGMTDDDQPHKSGGDRIAVYVVNARGGRRRVAKTSEEGIGMTLRVLREEGQITGDDRIGLFDRETREWAINPWARGAA